MRLDLELSDRVREGAARDVADRLSGLLDLPVTSSLSWRDPFEILPSPRGENPRVERVTRVVLGGGDRTASALVLAELPGNLGVLTTPAGTWTASLRGDGGLLDPVTRMLRRAGETVLPEDEAPATNEVVAEVTTLLHAAPVELVEAVHRARVPGPLPVLGPRATPALVGDGSEALALLGALHAVADGAPIEWALRRAGGVG